MISYVSGVTDTADAIEVIGPVMVFVRIHRCDIHSLLEIVDMHGVCAETLNRYRVLAPQLAVSSPCVIIMATVAESGCLKIAVYVVIIADCTAISCDTGCFSFTVMRMAVCAIHKALRWRMRFS